MKLFLKWTGFILFAVIIGLALSVAYIAGALAQSPVTVVQRALMQATPPAAYSGPWGYGYWGGYGQTGVYTSTQSQPYYAPGMMGRGMGPGMMGPGYGPQYQPLEKPLQKKDAEQMVENYIQSLHNPDLKLGKIAEKDTSFEVQILGKNKAVVDTVIVDKNTGWMQSAQRGPGRGPGAHYGYGMGSGMMGRGMGPGMMGPGYGPQYQQERKPLTEKDVKAMLENYVQSTRNPNLKLGKITEKDHYFEAEIVTQNDSLVDKILVDKQTGWMKSVY